MHRIGKVIVAVAAVALVVTAVRRLIRWLYASPGRPYRFFGCHPDPAVDDHTLADRIRSTLGPLEKRLDVPHVHVMVQDHVALLHGEVGWPHEAAQLERAVEQIAGVRGVESYLHIGLLPSDTRPSASRQVPAPPSDAKRRLLAAARSDGLDDASAANAVRAILSVLVDRIPSGERQHLLVHLPADVRAMAVPPKRTGDVSRPVRSVPEFVGAVRANGTTMPDGQALAIVAAVVREVRRLVPEEAKDVAAVLPEELRELWTADAPQ